MNIYIGPLIALIALAVIFGLLSLKGSDERAKPLFYDFKKDNAKFYTEQHAQEPKQKQKIVQAPVMQSNNEIKIQCLGGLLTQQIFKSKDRIVIGRDPKYCNILYNNNTRGISSIHCEIKRTSSGLIIVDKGSKCGTYLANGTKLNISEPVSIKHGDRFYLAEPENMFVIL